MKTARPRSEVVVIRVTPEDRAAILRHAEREGMTLSEFGRAAMLAQLLIVGDSHALRELGGGVVNAVRKLVHRKRSATA